MALTDTPLAGVLSFLSVPMARMRAASVPSWCRNRANGQDETGKKFSKNKENSGA